MSASTSWPVWLSLNEHAEIHTTAFDETVLVELHGEARFAERILILGPTKQAKVMLFVNLL